MTASDSPIAFIHGAVSMACLVAALLFLTYRRDSGDRLFAYFAAAFFVLGVNWATLGMFQPGVEHRHWVYALRLLAFLLIAIGIIDKNRRGKR
jgi:hypothetical protein